MVDEFTVFADLWVNLTIDWERILTFRRMGMLGLDSATSSLEASNMRFVKADLISGDFKHLLKDPEEFARSGKDDFLIKAMTQLAAGNFERSLNAASLVFAHSILDSALHDCLRIMAMASIDSWMPFVEGKKIALSEVQSKSRTAILKEAVEAEIERLERESLLKKVDRLFQLCKPKKQVYLTNGFRFDRDKLERLDKLRHDIVHAPGEHHEFPDLTSDLEFLQRSGLHCAVMISESSHAGLNTEEVVAALRRRGKSATETR